MQSQNTLLSIFNGNIKKTPFRTKFNFQRAVNKVINMQNIIKSGNQ